MGSYGNGRIMGVTKSAQDENQPLGVAKNPGTTPYATNVGSAIVTPGDIEEWKGDQISMVKSHFGEKFNELKEAYDKLVSDFNWNKVIYDSEIRFKPVMGNEYHLYQNEDGHRFLSIISEDEWGDLDKWKLRYVGTFKQDSRQKWCHIKIAEKYEEIE